MFSTNLVTAVLGIFFSATAVFAAVEDDTGASGTIVTAWPLFDYRHSPQDGFSNLSILGPVFKLQYMDEQRELAIRPFFYDSTNHRNQTTSSNYLYPLASRETSPEGSTFQFLKLVQSNTFRKNDPANEEKQSMFFPFYISGKSEKYGPYRSFFPFYGDIYERFWRDEYHFALFPLYGRTVKKGTTTRNYLYPFFSTIEGDRESGFQFWPLYGQSAKEGVYSKKFALWPFFFAEHTGLNTENPSHRFSILPFYSATDSSQKTSRSFLWPFFGYSTDLEKDQHEVDYLWPLWLTVRGSSKHVTSILPFYSEERGKESLERWYLWPLLKQEQISSPAYHQERNRVLFFLFTDNRERWTADGTERRRSALWPLFLYRKDTRGIKSLSVPAPIEPVFDREGIEKNWAPLWRLYQQRWNDNGDSAVSFLWNLYWHEIRQDAAAYEWYPLLQFQSDRRATDLSLFKGLMRYRNINGEKKLSLLWFPFGFGWGKADTDMEAKGLVIPRSVPQ